VGDRRHRHHCVLNSHATFEVEPRSHEAWRVWFEAFGMLGGHRPLVARDDRRVFGYASSSTFLTALLAELETEDVHRACAGVAPPNPASIRLHERFGYRHVGTFTEQGRTFGRYWDVAWYERPFPNHRDEEGP
jgi:phosphinothricin acetyltransferase